VQGSSELPRSEGYEKLPTDEHVDRIVSCAADESEILSDQVSRHCGCTEAANGFCSVCCLVLCNVSFVLFNRSLYFSQILLSTVVTHFCVLFLTLLLHVGYILANMAGVNFRIYMVENLLHVVHVFTNITYLLLSY
jgi:hypothetical protein